MNFNDIFGKALMIILLFYKIQSEEAFMCTTQRWTFFISDDLLCDGYNDCFNKEATDECNCPNTRRDICANGRCILESNICDEIDDCQDELESDESNCLENGLIYTPSLSQTISCLRRDAIRCSDDITCISARHLCDGVYDCPDKSDEIFSGPGFKCLIKSPRAVSCTLPQVNIYDYIGHCFNDIDLCFDSDGYLIEEICFQCLDGFNVISDSQVCDGILDCKDFSDECLCEVVRTPHVCNQIYSEYNPFCFSESTVPRDKHKEESGNDWIEGNFVTCDDDDGFCYHTSLLCNSRLDCDSGVDEEFCYSPSMFKNLADLAEEIDSTDEANALKNFINENSNIENPIRCIDSKKRNITAAACDGRPACGKLEDECNSECDVLPQFCKVNLTCVNPNNICDGEWDSDEKCSGGRIDEEELGCPKKFYCRNGEEISIDMKQVCDGIINCDDESDESSDRDCNDGRFYCEVRDKSNSSLKNPLFIPGSLKFNGRKDCADGSDECPKYTNSDIFSSRDEMIANLLLKVILWIVAPCAFFGNICVFVKTMLKITGTKNMNVIAKTHHIMILNLSVADGLMGLYLLMLSVMSLVFSSVYCTRKNTWTTSTLCQILGSLVITSSEASVFILGLMGFFRFYTMYRPFKTQFSHKIVKLAIMGLIVSWLVSILLAFLPWFLDYFITDLYYRSPFFTSDIVNRRKFQFFVAKVNSAAKITQAHFDEIITVPRTLIVNRTLQRINFVSRRVPDINSEGKFGFYSQNSICLPSYFTRVGDPGWQYSLMLVTLNFIIFIFMVVFYVLICYLSNPKRNKNLRATRSFQANSNQPLCMLQNRVARLLVTDFVCWIPVCLMSYAYLAGANLRNEVYAVCGIVLLPINSALNPLLYAGICDNIYAKIKTKLRRNNKTHLETSSNSIQIVFQNISTRVSSQTASDRNSCSMPSLSVTQTFATSTE